MNVPFDDEDGLTSQPALANSACRHDRRGGRGGLLSGLVWGWRRRRPLPHRLDGRAHKIVEIGFRPAVAHCVGAVPALRREIAGLPVVERVCHPSSDIVVTVVAVLALKRFHPLTNPLDEAGCDNEFIVNKSAGLQ